MARASSESLEVCPTCGTQGAVKGMRNYATWLFDLLPARIGATDLDAVIEQHFSNRGLVLEFKPSRYVPRGQQLLFDRLTDCGFDVWVVVDSDFEAGRLVMCIWRAGEPTQVWKAVTVDEFRQAVRAWWQAGEGE